MGLVGYRMSCQSLRPIQSMMMACGVFMLVTFQCTREVVEDGPTRSGKGPGWAIRLTGVIMDGVIETKMA